VISPMMNIGLLPASMILEKSLAYYQANQEKIPIESFEGFIRQVIGWREYVRFIYQEEGQKQRYANYFSSQNALSSAWYHQKQGKIGKIAKLGIPPLDDMIDHALQFGYCHHIERLMYLGVMMTLMSIRPNEAYRWFMEMFIDAYEWVMIPNVFGMCTFADGGLMMTRPYLCSSNYILRMSSYQKDSQPWVTLPNGLQLSWNRIWDALYYRFIDQHQHQLRSFYATARNVGHWDRKDPKEKKALLDIANQYLSLLDKY
jgi:deoxyribodipyrimidine photolyase-related protein